MRDIVRASIWTIAPSYTVMNNNVGTLDVMAGLRYTSLSVSLAYQFTAASLPLAVGGGFWPNAEGAHDWPRDRSNLPLVSALLSFRVGMGAGPVSFI
jgi:hypothetical protein